MKKTKSSKSSMTKLFTAVILSFVACSSPIKIHNISEAKKAAGHQITFKGKAYNAKLGAAVLSDEFGLTCIDPSTWPESQVEKEVQVTGVLELTDDYKYAKDPISQGTEGQDWLIRKCVLNKFQH